MSKKPTPLRLAIVQSGRTQRQIADQANLAETRLSQIVNGHWNPDDATRKAIADALHTTEAELWPAATEAAA